MATYKDIKRQIADLERKAELAKKAELSKIIAAIKAQIAEYDLTAEDLFGGKRGRRAGAKAAKPPGPKKVYPPKYQDPKSGATWTGLGRAPAWIKEAIAKGKKDAFLIEKSATTTKPAPKTAAKTVKDKPTPKVVVKKKAPAKPAVKKAADGKKLTGSAKKVKPTIEVSAESTMAAAPATEGTAS